MKAKVSLNLARLSVPVKIEKARQIITSMAGNVNFTTPAPALASITAAALVLETAFNNAQDGGKTKTALMHEKEKLLDDLLTRLGSYVEDIALGVESVILSAGMDVRKAYAPIGELDAPENLLAKIGNMEGEIDLKWNSVKGAKSYVVQVKLSTANDWNPAGISTKAKFTATGLSSGAKYFFHVAAVGSSGQGPWSDISGAMSL